MDISELQKKVAEFRDTRNWKQFHTPKNLAQALASEVGELNDLFLWDREPDLKMVGREMADILIFLLSLADVTGIDLTKEFFLKLLVNKLNYPEGKAHGTARKYTEL